MFSTAQSGTQPWWHAEEPKSELLILCSSSDAGCFKHKTETGIIYWTKCPENWAQRKIQVKAFAALPFLEDRIPPELVQDQPSCRDILWNFTLWHFDCEIMRPHFTLYTSPWSQGIHRHFPLKGKFSFSCILVYESCYCQITLLPALSLSSLIHF